MIQLGFLGKINASVQIGDIAYYVNTTAASSTNGGFTQNIDSEGDSTSPVVLGPITSITSPATSITVDGVVIAVDFIIQITEDSSLTPSMLDNLSSTSFIFFTKDNNVNVSQIRGYYGELEFKNNSTSKAEMFATACEVVESSK